MGIEELNPMPARPDHPDFWKLSDIILQMDGALAEAPTQEAKDVVWEAFFKDVIDTKSLNYLGFQRAIRAIGVTTVAGVQEHMNEIIKMTVLYTEAFLVGTRFKDRT